MKCCLGHKISKSLFFKVNLSSPPSSETLESPSENDVESGTSGEYNGVMLVANSVRNSQSSIVFFYQ